MLSTVLVCIIRVYCLGYNVIKIYVYIIVNMVTNSVRFAVYIVAVTIGDLPGTPEINYNCAICNSPKTFNKSRATRIPSSAH